MEDLEESISSLRESIEDLNMTMKSLTNKIEKEGIKSNEVTLDLRNQIKQLKEAIESQQ